MNIYRIKKKSKIVKKEFFLQSFEVGKMTKNSKIRHICNLYLEK